MIRSKDKLVAHDLDREVAEILAPPSRRNGSNGAGVARVRTLLNRSVTRDTILRRVEIIRPALHGKLIRVSESSLHFLESKLRNWIDSELRNHPSVGATIRLGDR